MWAHDTNSINSSRAGGLGMMYNLLSAPGHGAEAPWQRISRSFGYQTGAETNRRGDLGGQTAVLTIWPDVTQAPRPHFILYQRTDVRKDAFTYFLLTSEPTPGCVFVPVAS